MRAENAASRPPIYTVLVEVVGWTLDRTAGIPKSQRFSFGQRLDGLALDSLQWAIKAIFTAGAAAKQEYLGELLLSLEQMQALWRLACDRHWVSREQLVYISGRLAEAGRMASGWRRQQARRSGSAANLKEPGPGAGPKP